MNAPYSRENRLISAPDAKVVLTSLDTKELPTYAALKAQLGENQRFVVVWYGKTTGKAFQARQLRRETSPIFMKRWMDEYNSAWIVWATSVLPFKNRRRGLKIKWFFPLEMYFYPQNHTIKNAKKGIEFNWMELVKLMLQQEKYAVMYNGKEYSAKLLSINHNIEITVRNVRNKILFKLTFIVRKNGKETFLKERYCKIGPKKDPSVSLTFDEFHEFYYHPLAKYIVIYVDEIEKEEAIYDPE